MDFLGKMRKNSILYHAGTKCGHFADTGRQDVDRILTPFCFFLFEGDNDDDACSY